MDKSKKLALLDRKEQITELALGGKHPKEIAFVLGLSEATVKKYLDEAAEEAKVMYQENMAKLLAKTYSRAEMLIDRLMERVVGGEEDDLNLQIIDRLDKLFNTQAKLGRVGQPINVKHSGDPDNPIQIEAIFRSESPEHKRALELAQAHPEEYLLLDENPVFEEALYEYAPED